MRNVKDIEYYKSLYIPDSEYKKEFELIGIEKYDRMMFRLKHSCGHELLVSPYDYGRESFSCRNEICKTKKRSTRRKRDDSYYIDLINSCEKSDRMKEFQFIELDRSDSKHVKAVFQHSCGNLVKVDVSSYLKGVIGCSNRNCDKIYRSQYRKDCGTKPDEYYFDKIKSSELSCRQKEYEVLSLDRSRRLVYVNLKHKICGTEICVQFNNFLNDSFCCTNIECKEKFDNHLSEKEQNLLDYIREKYPDARKSPRGEFGPFEFDVYIPELKIAFEYNGTYWHSDKIPRINRGYHSAKSSMAVCNNIKLYHIWEYNSEEKNKDIIDSRIGRNKRIPARKCIIKTINNKIAKEFLDKYHLDNYAQSFKSYGLFYNGELISVASLRVNGSNIELARFATKSGVAVIGGFSKILNIIRQEYTGKKLISYCDRDLCSDYRDSVYYKNGFNYLGDSGPILRYYDAANHKIIPRQKLQKHKIKENYPDWYDDSKTEKEILQEHNIWSLWNSGNFKFELDL